MKTKRTNKCTFKWAPTCARHTGKHVEIGDARKWGEGGGRTLTGQGDSANFRSRCRELVRPTEKFKKSDCLL